LLYIFKLVTRAEAPKDFHRISSLVKLIMLSGILSLVFFKYYYPA